MHGTLGVEPTGVARRGGNGVEPQTALHFDRRNACRDAAVELGKTGRHFARAAADETERIRLQYSKDE